MAKELSTILTEPPEVEKPGRNRRKLARDDHTYPDNDGLTRKVRIAVADDSVDNKGRPIRPVAYLDRPIQKLILLLPADLSEDREIPIEEPDK